MLHKGLILSQGQSPSVTSARGRHDLCLQVTHVSTDLLYAKHFAYGKKMLHMQHHFLCNISYVVIAESMGKSLKYVYNNACIESTNSVI